MGQEERSGEEGEALKDHVGPRFGLPKHRWQDAPARQGGGGMGSELAHCPGEPLCWAALCTPCGTLLHREVCPASPVTRPGKSYEAEAIIIIIIIIV